MSEPSKRILCYGDSNTWGYVPGTGARYDEETRWTGVLQKELGCGYRVLEEGLNGRTSVFDDPRNPGRNGRTGMLPCLVSQKSIDLLILMLGTNDLLCTDAWGSAEAIKALIKYIRVICFAEKDKTPIFTGKERILLVSPPLAHEAVANSGTSVQYRDIVQQAKQFGYHFRKAADEMGVFFLDSAPIAPPSPIDGIHLPKESHLALGKVLAASVKSILAE